MLTDFNSLSADSRTWIYQSDRVLTKEEQNIISSELGYFLEKWAAHGNNLMASGTILYDVFLVISTDESLNIASGCSIDSSFSFVQELGTKMSVDFFQRTNLAFLVHDEVMFLKLSDLKSKIQEGIINGDSIFFDNTIQKKVELETKWHVKASETWLSRYFKSTVNV